MNTNSNYLNFSEALYKLKENSVITRVKKKDSFLTLIWKKGNSVMCSNGIKIRPYEFTINDIFAEDWICYGPIEDIMEYAYKSMIKTVNDLYSNHEVCLFPEESKTQSTSFILEYELESDLKWKKI